jgi:pimeloyl-ACP methyl ester carboxylesterase
MPAELIELKVRDVTIKLHRAGRGPTVLFLHGAGGVPQWLPFFDALAERYELLVPEHPGFGGSDDPAWIRSMPDLAMFYLDLVEEAGLDRIHLIGNSLGGWLAAEILIRDRSRLRASSNSRRPASASRVYRAAITSSGRPRRQCAISITTNPLPTASWR